MTAADYSGVMVFAEQLHGVVHRVTYELLHQGRQLAETLGEEVWAACPGPPGMEEELRELGRRGADRVYYQRSPELEAPHELLYRRVLAELLQEVRPRICLFGATEFGRSLAPRVAAAMGAGLTADCTGLEIDPEDRSLLQVRPAFTGNILAHIKSRGYPQMATVRFKEFPEARRDAERAADIMVREVDASEQTGLAILERLDQPGVNIADAQVVVSGGKGLEGEADFALLRDLAHRLGGVLGASRAAVEEGYVSKDHQVGYSGSRVKPALYLAFGISGAPQHLAGMRESDIIVAVNRDPAAPIFSVADYGLVADWRTVARALLQRLPNGG